MNAYYAEYLKTHGTAAELRAILGPSWGICRPTPRNLERYTRCITKKQYDAANARAVLERAQRPVLETSL